MLTSRMQFSTMNYILDAATFTRFASRLAVFSLCIVFSIQTLAGQTTQERAQVKKIYVVPLTSERRSQEMRESLVRQLRKSGKFQVVNSLPVSVTNSPEKGAYPIATFTWFLLPQSMEDPAKKAALFELLQWALTDGQKQCSALAYSPLPKTSLRENWIWCVGRNEERSRKRLLLATVN